VLAAFEWLATNTGGYQYENSKNSHVQWSMVSLPDAAHKDVIEVTFNANDPNELVNDNGWFGVAAGNAESATVDLSAFAAGSISFDMRIIKNGQIADYLDFKMECIYPCTSQEFWVADPSTLNEWKTYTLSIARMIETGLDIKRVNNLFIIKPWWGNQRGQYVVQLDNIRLNKQFTPVPFVPPLAPTSSLSRNYFQNGASADSYFTAGNSMDGLSSRYSEIFDGSNTVIDVITYVDNFPIMLLSLLKSGEKYNMEDYYYGDVVFDLKVLNYAGSTADFEFWADCGGRCRSTPTYKLGHPVEGVWHTMRIPVKALVANGLELSRIYSAFGLYLSGNSKAGMHIQVNNVRWEYTPSSGGSSSSSSSSGGQSAAFNCTADVCDLFKDQPISGRGVLADFEWKANGTGGYHFQSASDAHVQWAFVYTQDPNHNTAIEVTFNANDPGDVVNDNGWFGIAVGKTENATADLSAYANGAISFDMRVFKNGLIADNFDMKMECVYPCTSEEFWVPDGAVLGQWQTHTISIKRMIETGLDIKKVNNLFIIKPGWGGQRGQYVVHLDNIRLLKNYVAPSVTVPAKPLENKTLFYYQNGVSEGNRIYIANTLDGLGASFNEITDGSSTVIDLLTNIDNMGLYLFVSGELYQRQNLLDFYYGNVVFDLRVLNYAGNTNALNFTVNCGGRCRNVPSFTIGHPEAGSWFTYRIPVKTLVENGVDLTRVTERFMLTLVGTSQPGVHLQVNNIRWESLSP
jgi:hypothetical protein